MPSKETIQQFNENFKNASGVIQSLILNAWSGQTVVVKGSAKDIAPQTTLQALSKSIDAIKAKITDTGVTSYVVAKVPYAVVIEAGERDGKPIKLKPIGAVSYYVGKGKSRKAIKKIRQGVTGFLSKAARKEWPGFMEITKNTISKAWEKL